MPSIRVLLLCISLLLSRPPLRASRPEPKETSGKKDPISVLSHHPNTTWQSFQRFVDLERGSHVPGLSELKRYLHRFGYLSGPAANFTNAYDAQFESAVTLYQSKLGLPSTGRLDHTTLAQIMSPRCGFNDEATGLHSVGRFAFFPGQPRWTQSRPMILTYAVSSTDTIDYIGRDKVEAAVRRAFERWARVIPVSFVPAMAYETADVKVGFYAGDHGDGEPFDGVLGVLAHAFSPESGKLHLDAAERWAVDFGTEESKVAVDLESVATHEIGHVLGLAHSTLKEAVMYPSLSPRTRKMDLTVDDIVGVQTLYGSNPYFKFSSLLESDTSSASSIGSSRRSSFTGTYSNLGILGLMVTLCV